jgi:DNA-binding NarL/FixJ family response regulator
LITIAVVDDDTLMRKAFTDGIDGRVRTVVASPSVEQLPADVPTTCVAIVLDLRLRSLSSAEQGTVLQGTAAVRSASRLGLPILLYTNEQRLEVLAACMAVGASGLVFKADPLEDLVEGLLQVVEGLTFITPAAAGLLSRLDTLRSSGLALTDRQIDVLKLRASGFERSRIAERLHLSPKTVETHIAGVGQVYGQYLRDRGEGQLLHDLGLEDGDLVDPGHLPRRRRRRLF